MLTDEEIKGIETTLRDADMKFLQSCTKTRDRLIVLGLSAHLAGLIVDDIASSANLRAVVMVGAQMSLLSQLGKMPKMTEPTTDIGPNSRSSGAI